MKCRISLLCASTNSLQAQLPTYLILKDFFSFLVFQVSKRLQQELMSLMMGGDRGISAFPDGDKMLTWVATVEGPQVRRRKCKVKGEILCVKAFLFP